LEWLSTEPNEEQRLPEAELRQINSLRLAAEQLSAYLSQSARGGVAATVKPAADLHTAAQQVFQAAEQLHK
jgi:hypothetical protein